MLKMFTWNMQKSPTVKPNANPIVGAYDNARLKVLQRLIAESNIGFITEPGKDLRTAVAEDDRVALAKLGDGFAYRDLRPDNQDEDGACRPILYVKQPIFSNAGGSVKCGKVDAYRYPCAAVIQHQLAKILVVSLHATSGYSGKFNTTDVVKDFIEFVKEEQLGGLIVAGDFNAHMSTTDANCEYVMPDGQTNQGAAADGKSIDGFFFFSNSELTGSDKYIVKFSPLKAKQFTEFDGKLVLSCTANSGQNAGYFAEDAYNGKKYLYRLSDHMPVVIEVAVEVTKAPEDAVMGGED